MFAVLDNAGGWRGEVRRKLCEICRRLSLSFESLVVCESRLSREAAAPDGGGVQFRSLEVRAIIIRPSFFFKWVIGENMSFDVCFDGGAQKVEAIFVVVTTPQRRRAARTNEVG